MKVSVIVPVYNCEQFICKCLDSVINQTLSEIEIICIDDCSVDDSLRILKSYEEKCDRIRILHNEVNRGLSYSRNRGVEAAEGEYIQFLDADDYLSRDDSLELLYTVAAGNKLDFLRSRLLKAENGKLNISSHYPDRVADTVYAGRELLYKLELYGIYAWHGTLNFVRRDFVRGKGIVFYDGILHEDVLYSYNLYYYAERAMCINQHTYVYVKHTNSLTTQRKNLSHLRGYLTCMNEILKKDLLDASLEFRCAAMKYFIRMYNNVTDIKSKINYDIQAEMFDAELRKIYHLFITDNKGLVNKDKVVQNLRRISDSRKRYLYGAGAAAKELLQLISEYDIAIDGVYVTDPQKSAETILGHKVSGIQDCDNSDTDVLFIVAISKPIVGDVEELLSSKGFTNILFVC
ncbi:MAG: glycosyltransferase [Lachnospiraceae bacterium]|nr:glycosyltransferase [Lachnospiraceae bacterium]